MVNVRRAFLVRDILFSCDHMPQQITKSFWLYEICSWVKGLEKYLLLVQKGSKILYSLFQLAVEVAVFLARFARCYIFFCLILLLKSKAIIHLKAVPHLWRLLGATYIVVWPTGSIIIFFFSQ